MTKMVTPMDLALAGMQVWRRQAQNAAMTGLRVAGMANDWALPPSAAAGMLAETQREIAEAGQKMALTMLTGEPPVQGRRT